MLKGRHMNGKLYGPFLMNAKNVRNIVAKKRDIFRECARIFVRNPDLNRVGIFLQKGVKVPDKRTWCFF